MFLGCQISAREPQSGARPLVVPPADSWAVPPGTQRTMTPETPARPESAAPNSQPPPFSACPSPSQGGLSEHRRCEGADHVRSPARQFRGPQPGRRITDATTTTGGHPATRRRHPTHPCARTGFAARGGNDPADRGLPARLPSGDAVPGRGSDVRRWKTGGRPLWRTGEPVQPARSNVVVLLPGLLRHPPLLRGQGRHGNRDHPDPGWVFRDLAAHRLDHDPGGAFRDKAGRKVYNW